MRRLTYKNDVTHVIGRKLTSEYLTKGDRPDTIKHWVATDATFDGTHTIVEYDEIGGPGDSS